jgi:hypothetical protein
MISEFPVEFIKVHTERKMIAATGKMVNVTTIAYSEFVEIYANPP